MATAYLMKLVSIVVTPHVKKKHLNHFLFCTPFLSLRSRPVITNKNHHPLLKKILIFAPLSAGIFFLASHMTPSLSYWEIILLSPIIYVATEAVGAMGQLIFSPTGKKIFLIHRHPITSSSLAHFWGFHWNVWVQDWLKDVAYPFRKRPVSQRLLITFFLSGLFHEIMFNLPFWLVYKKSYFGMMMLYFMIQAVGVGVEKKILRGRPVWVKRCYLWIMVFAPSPIFLTHPLLLFLGLTNG